MPAESVGRGFNSVLWHTIFRLLCHMCLLVIQGVLSVFFFSPGIQVFLHPWIMVVDAPHNIFTIKTWFLFCVRNSHISLPLHHMFVCVYVFVSVVWIVLFIWTYSLKIKRVSTSRIIIIIIPAVAVSRRFVLACCSLSCPLWEVAVRERLLGLTVCCVFRVMHSSLSA
jgi:hypothetical protein